MIKITLNLNTYKAAKLFHLAGLVLWLGPGTGGYILFLISRLQNQASIEDWLFREYINLIHLEALGLAVLIASGLIMRSIATGLKEAGWLKRKLVIVFSALVPLEVAELLIYHTVVKKALLAGAVQDAVYLFDRFSAASFVILAITIPAVFWLAVFRPEFRSKRA